jgi:hypothetical protein
MSCDLQQGCCAAPALHLMDTQSQLLSSIGPDLQAVMSGWNRLPDAVRTAITMLVRANVPELPDPEKVNDERDKNRKAAAMQIARDCRFIVQRCLREEEWQDADQELCAAILARL